MDISFKDIKISLIISAYNEESRIGAVLAPVKQTSLVDEVIVVDDGSIDRTAQIAGTYGAKVIRHKKNKGKGAAVKSGIIAASGEILVFLDADLIGLKPGHIKKMVIPLLVDPDLVMTRGQFRGGRFSTDFAQAVVPSISGQRAVRRSFIASLPDLEDTRYGIEVTITKYAKQKKVKVKDVVLKGLTQAMKEEKEGYVKGLVSRAKMYRDIAVSLASEGKTTQRRKSKSGD